MHDVKKLFVPCASLNESTDSLPCNCDYTTIPGDASLHLRSENLAMATLVENNTHYDKFSTYFYSVDF
jgi:hypothetical protein